MNKTMTSKKDLLRQANVATVICLEPNRHQSSRSKLLAAAQLGTQVIL